MPPKAPLSREKVSPHASDSDGDPSPLNPAPRRSNLRTGSLSRGFPFEPESKTDNPTTPHPDRPLPNDQDFVSVAPLIDSEQQGISGFDEHSPGTILTPSRRSSAGILGRCYPGFDAPFVRDRKEALRQHKSRLEASMRAAQQAERESVSEGDQEWAARPAEHS
ncbi:unnamed protein product [Zymoseptoria tritici ST99CH_1A5]|uniref:Uncharacterized protein n=2 Tax=Zymoseptoria tritici TaxID=1047171 RepID=A0A2H1GFF1_ZYMTR|nr:unnamed protein product [Zymoseptoria tritici ST99CH_1E4]SMY24206.1 unnamed protein product [Zymoseptoria tritici ST99CH_1A5]